MTTQQPEALRLADALCEAIAEYPDPTALEAQAAAELRRLHAYCQELESQVILDCMTHVQNPAEIEHVAGDVSKNGAGLNMSTQHARITELESQLAQRFDAADVTTAAAQGFRDGVASAASWISVDARLPEPNTPVLLDIGKMFPLRALWAGKHTVSVGTDVDDWGEYDEKTDEYYCPEGWYEWNEHEEVHWAVSETPRAWRELPKPLPAAPAQPVAEPANADSVLEDAARWRELREQHESDEDLCCVFAPNDMRECLVPVGSLPGELDAFMDSERADRKQGGA